MKMIEVSTKDLTGPALNWMVAQVMGLDVALAPPHYGTGWRVYLTSTGAAYRPSTDWAQGGPLLEPLFVGFGAVCSGKPPVDDDPKLIRAHAHKLESNGFPFFSRLGSGPTILVAACRAIVLVHRGDVVQIPAVLAPDSGSDTDAAA